MSYTQLAERVTALEVKVETLLETQQSIDKNLEELINLKHKGMGAFWAASAILGTIIMTVLKHAIEWFKNG